MTENDYQTLLLEEAYISKLFTNLYSEEQRILHYLASPKNKHDIHRNGKLSRTREDMQTLMPLLTVITDLINVEIQKKYEIKFKSFKVTDHQEQIPVKEDNLQGKVIPLT